MNLKYETDLFNTLKIQNNSSMFSVLILTDEKKNAWISC